MTLKEMLESMDYGQQIKVGAENGTAFFFCGKAGHLIEEIESFEQAMQYETENAVERTRKDFVRWTTEGFKFKTCASVKAKVDKKIAYSDWTKGRVEEAVHDIRVAYTEWLGITAAKEEATVEAERLHRERVGIGDREVINTFEADPIAEEIPTTVIIVHGWEYGRFWTVDEAKIAKARENTK